MSTKSKKAIAENRAVFDDRPILESELEVTESENYAVYVAERADTFTDEIHLFPLAKGEVELEWLHQTLMEVTETFSKPVSKVSFERGTDGRLVLKVETDPAQGTDTPGRVLKYILSKI